jgi:hypothetical protein
MVNYVRQDSGKIFEFGSADGRKIILMERVHIKWNSMLEMYN